MRDVRRACGWNPVPIFVGNVGNGCAMRIAGSTNMTQTLLEELEFEVLLGFAKQVAATRPKLAERLCELLDHMELLTSEEGLQFSGFSPEECAFLLRTLESVLNCLGQSA